MISKKYLKLEYLRKRFSYTQTDFAERLGLSNSQYGKKANGFQPWYLDECMILSELINKHLKAINESPMTINEIFHAEKVSKKIQKKKGA